MPTPGPLELVLHRHPGETSRKPSNLPARKWRAPQKYIWSRRTSLPPWSGRVGAPGEGQSRPTQPPPRRLQGVMGDLPPRNNKWIGTTIGMKPNKTPKIRPLFTRTLHSTFVFNPSFYHFIINFSYSLPEHFCFFPGRPCCDKAQQNGRKKGRKEEKNCCTIPFIKFARFRLHLYRLNKIKNYLP